MSGASKEPVLGVLPYKGLISTEGVPLPARQLGAQQAKGIRLCARCQSLM